MLGGCESEQPVVRITGLSQLLLVRTCAKDTTMKRSKISFVSLRKSC